MSRKGDCWDNAPMESLNGTLKVECVHGEHFRTRAQARQAIIDYIGYYNTDRRHSSLGYLPPRCSSAAGEPRLRIPRRNHCSERVAHRRPVPGSSQATEPAGRGQRFPQILVSASRGPAHRGRLS